MKKKLKKKLKKAKTRADIFELYVDMLHILNLLDVVSLDDYDHLLDLIIDRVGVK